MTVNYSNGDTRTSPLWVPAESWFVYGVSGETAAACFETLRHAHAPSLLILPPPQPNCEKEIVAGRELSLLARIVYSPVPWRSPTATMDDENLVCCGCHTPLTSQDQHHNSTWSQSHPRASTRSRLPQPGLREMTSATTNSRSGIPPPGSIANKATSASRMIEV